MPRKELGMAGCNSGSCDSMASTASNHSQRSDNSYDYLSVEEKECLLFLEETIGSLDAEADSGGATAGPEPGEPGEPRKGRGKYLFHSSVSGILPIVSSLSAGFIHQQPPSLFVRTNPSLLSRRLGEPWVPEPRLCWPRGDLGNGLPPPSREQQRGTEQKSSKSISCSGAPAAAPSPGCSSLPRGIPAANGASGSKGRLHTLPAGKPAQEVPQEGRLDQASSGSHSKSMIIQPADPFQDELEWSRSHRSDAEGEAAKESRIRTLWGRLEKSTLEEAPQEPDAKRGPPTAPKPRKLPPNIILKTSRNSPTEHNQRVKAAPPPSATSQPSPASDSAAEKGNSGHLDPKEKEKARREALEKLGLSQGRREPSAHLHPHARETPLPVPGQPGEGCVPGMRPMAFKSNTLERSGVGLGSSISSSKEHSARSSSSLGKMSFMERLAPGFLRSSRPRPASLAPGKDFGGLKEQEEQDKSSKRRSHPLPSFPRLPRSAVSVKISPKAAADENRREALKKLGLLKE
ncbi:SARG protein, partial [Anthoscopus minutus]|nr:SARG protein [Anthoscopus minutus]